MDNNTQDRKSGHPSRESQDELEEALKWLEELTSRKGTPPEPSTPVPSATIESPFRGLIEDDEGDLPDWLREVPSAQNLEGVTNTEPESRLDWLARMAQRESIEELPTLEWRRIGEPMQSALLPPTHEETPETGERIPTEEMETAVYNPEPAAEPEPEAAVAPIRETTEPEPADDPLAWLRLDPEETETLDADSLELGELELGERGLGEFEFVDLAMDFDPDDELPSVDDLDAAMAWIEELAASQDAPIEDIPSVVDRALASKLLMETEARQNVSPLDELGSDAELLGDTPLHPFIEEEDLADTVVLVETMAADQGLSVESPSDAGDSFVAEPEAPELGAPELEAPEPESPALKTLDLEAPEFETPDLGSPELEIPELETTELEIPELETTEPDVLEIVTPAEEAIRLLDGEEHEANIEFAIVDETSDFIEPPPDALSFEEAMAYLDEVAAEQIDETNSIEIEEADILMPAEEAADLVEGVAETLEPIAEPDSPDDTSAADEFESISFLEAQAEELAADDISPFTEFEELADAEEYDPTVEWDDEVEESEPAVSEFAPWEDDIEAPDAELLIPTDQPAATSSLEAKLLALDAMALPGGRTLDDIDASMRTAQLAPLRDLPSALNWLESTLVKETAEAPAAEEVAEELDGEDLIAQMPEDPDAVLAWLEQMAEEEETDRQPPAATMEDDSATFISGQQAAEPLTEDLAAADLLDMPDDPDEAMAWLESLARGGARDEDRETADAAEGETVSFRDEDIEALPESAAEAVDFAIEEAEVVDDAEAAIDEVIVEPVEVAVEEIETAADDMIDEAEAAIDEVIVEPVEVAVEEIETAADDMIDEAEAAIDEVIVEPVEVVIGEVDAAAVDVIGEAEAAVDEVVVEPVEVSIEEIEAAADEMIAGVAAEVEEIEVEFAPAEPLSPVTQGVEALEAEALARGVEAVEEIVVEPDAAETAALQDKPKRRRARAAKAKVEEAPAAEEPPPAKDRPASSWVDLLRPLD